MAYAKEEPQLKERCFLTKYGIPEVDKIIQAQKFRPRETIRYIRTMLPNDKNTVEDRISELPVDILMFILSLLSMKEGATTCVLSRRWRNLWRTSATCLVFNASTVFGDNYSRDIFFPQKQNSEHASHQSKNIVLREQREFTRRVNKFLQSSCPPLVIDALQVSFPLAKESASHIERWLNSAAAQGITELDLYFNFKDFGLEYSIEETYKFTTQIIAQNLSHSLKYLSLRCCIFEFPHNFQGFNSLVSLVLEEVRITASDVQNILSTSSSLQILSMRHCYILRSSRCLKFSSPSLVLKHITCCACLGISKLEVLDINILSLELEFKFTRPRLSIKNAPNLTRVKLAGHSPIEFTCKVLPPLETLSLALNSLGSDGYKMFELSNLKQLVVSAMSDVYIDLLNVIYLLEACPMLQKLEINMGISIEAAANLLYIRMRTRAPNHNLKEVDIYGFEGDPTAIEFVKYLLKNAIVLEKIKLSTKQKEYFDNGLWHFCERTLKGEGISITDVPKLLEGEVHPPTELIIESHD